MAHLHELGAAEDTEDIDDDATAALPNPLVLNRVLDTSLLGYFQRHTACSRRFVSLAGCNKIASQEIHR